MMRTTGGPKNISRPRRARRTALLASFVCVLAARIFAAEPGPAPDATPASHQRGSTSARGAGQATGGISGKVNLSPRLSSRQVRFHLYPDAVAADTRHKPPAPPTELRNVVVYVEYVPSANATPSATAPAAAATTAASASQAATPVPAIRQEDLTFVPHVLAITRGTEVEFPNTDPVFHNVFSLSRAESFDLGRYPKGSSKRVRFDSPGVVKVFCHIHSDMSAIVVVLDNSFFVSPDADGNYVIDGLPPGDYKVTGWHERAHPVTLRVHIEAGKYSPADFNIPLTDENGG
jgi:plastocyanin